MKKGLFLSLILLMVFYFSELDLETKILPNTEEPVSLSITNLNQVPLKCQSCVLDNTLLDQYRFESYLIPDYLVPLIDEFIMIPQSELDDLFSPLTSGYTKTFFEDNKYVGNEIYISDSLFRKTTLLHESLHVLDAIYQVSSSSKFLHLMNLELDPIYNSRILDYYDEPFHASEFFVESYINYLEDYEQFKYLQPNTYNYIQQFESQLIKNYQKKQK